MSEAKTKTNTGKATASEPKQKPVNVPVHRIRLGLIGAAIWRNETVNGPLYQVSVDRRYSETDPQTGEVTWNSSDSMKIDDIPVMQEVLRLAFDWMYQHTK